MRSDRHIGFRWPWLAAIVALAVVLPACPRTGREPVTNGGGGSDLTTADQTLPLPEDVVAGVDQAGDDATPAADLPPPEDKGGEVGVGGCCDHGGDCEPGQLCVAGADPAAPGSCVEKLAPGACYGDLDCLAEAVCQGAVVGDCPAGIAPVAGSCIQLPDGCCFGDEDCPGEMVCAWARLETPEQAGVCWEPLKPGECFTNHDCPSGLVCADAGACPCPLDCLWAGPGKCQPGETPHCCASDQDCPSEMVCVAGQQGTGSCMPEPLFGECFSAADCPAGYLCSGADQCGCNMNCLSQVGLCHPIGADCCNADIHCSPGYTCFGASPEDPAMTGVCEPPPLMAGQCWGDIHCLPGQLCEGGSACPCNADCDAPDQFGQCVGGEDCCASDKECEPGLICIGASQGGTCEPIPPLGKCFKDADCSQYTQSCVGATICPCGKLCFAPTTPGDCLPLPSGCCYDDQGCQPGYLCKAIGWGDKFAGVCKEDLKQIVGCPPGQICCWDDADCPAGKQCSGGSLCGCIEMCPMCGACQEDQVGMCQ